MGNVPGLHMFSLNEALHLLIEIDSQEGSKKIRGRERKWFCLKVNKQVATLLSFSLIILL